MTKATVKALLLSARHQLRCHEVPHLEAEILLAHTLGVNRTYLVTYPERQVNSEDLLLFEALLARRQQGEPIAYIVGHKEFWSLDLMVDESCLIPRPETEMLVELVLQKFSPQVQATLVDLGCGSGAIALAIASERPQWKIIAIDQSQEALNIAKFNADNLKIANVEFLHGDWCQPLLLDDYSIIVTNPPYIAASDPHLHQGDVQFEPHAALVAGEDGLQAIREIVLQARSYLTGWILIEHGYMQGKNVRQLLASNGYTSAYTVQDYTGRDRVTMACYNEKN